MGTSFGKAFGKDDEKKKDEPPKRTGKREDGAIFYDNDGVLRCGIEPRNRDHELKLVLAADTSGGDDGPDAAGNIWCIVDANWIEAWLAFVHHHKRSPPPGPGVAWRRCAECANRVITRPDPACRLCRSAQREALRATTDRRGRG
jgi:hypothetical protein